MEDYYKKLEDNISLVEQKLKDYHTNIFNYNFIVIYSDVISAMENIIKEYRVKELQLHLLNDETNNKIKSLEQKISELSDENKLYKHRLDVANEFIESRIDGMIPEHYDDLNYILNECDLESTW